jgi:hypothetical protein
MATFTAYVIVHGDAGPVQFAPGDEVPEWAAPLVGEHVLTEARSDDEHNSDAEQESDADGNPAEDSDAETDDNEEESDGGEGAEDPESAPVDEVPDFTAAAPRRGRARKQ